MLDPTVDHRQSITAVGAGGLEGRGVTEASQTRFDYLPEHATDFVFASTAVAGGPLTALGITGALAAGRVLAAYLYETRPTDPVIYGAVAVAFLVAGTLACLGPAWRATTVDPLLALKAE